MKKIALFADGTGNSSASPHKTNVWRAYKALDRRPGSNQVAFYDNGVGTTSFTPLALLGLAFGWGLARNVRQIYGFLCRTYDPGDKIYAFGFSRGAFTIRMLMGLIVHEGIIDRAKVANDRDLDRLILAAYRRFRQERFMPSLLSFFLRPLRDWIVAGYGRCVYGLQPYETRKNIRPVPVDFVGVWDTVDAYGLPIDELTRAWDMVIWPLTAKDRELSGRVACARHALSLDEQRESFDPMLWNEGGRQFGVHIDRERLVQVWFPGVHANVGGGYPDDSLAFAPLVWILDESRKRSGLSYLQAEYSRLAAQQSAQGPAHDSRRGYGIFYRYAPRNIERLNNQCKPGLFNWLKGRLITASARWAPGRCRSRVNNNKVRVWKPIIHHTVFERIRSAGGVYVPMNVPEDYGVLTKAGTIVSEPRLYEQPSEAADRSAGQWVVGNMVLLRKFLYYTMLVLTATFLTYPYWAGDSGGNVARILEPWFGTFSAAIRAIPEFVGRVPGLGFFGGWAQEYAQHPFGFVLFLGAIGLVVLWGRGVSASIQVKMRKLWHHVIVQGEALHWREARGWEARLARWRARCGDGVSRGIRNAAEAVTAGVLVFLVAAVGSQVYFTFADGLGAVCGGSSAVRGPLGTELDLDPKEMCVDTGVEVAAEELYEVEFRVSEDWADKTIEADARGLKQVPMVLHAFAPLRRHWLVGWYEPVMRIDNRLFDRYPLTWHEVGVQKGGVRESGRLVARFRARRSGKLYFYVNDAVFFAWSGFYRNNRGTAKVTVREVAAARGVGEDR